MFVNLLFKKVSRLSTYSIKSANLGTIINFIASDLYQVEMKMMFLFVLIMSPIFVTLTGILLYYRLGPWGLLAIGILIIIFPV